MARGWGNNAWGDYGWGGAIPTTGVAATGAVGTSELFVTVPISGVSSVGVIGDVVESNEPGSIGDVAYGDVGSVSYSHTVALTGVSASGLTGFGWGSDTWGSNSWGGVSLVPVQSFEVAISGVSLAGSVGDVVETNTGNGLGDVGYGYVGTVVTDRSVAVSGVELTGLTGAAVGGATVVTSGVYTLGTVNQVIVPIPTNQANGAVGSVGVNREVALTGVSASGLAGSVALGARSFALTGNYAAGDVGVVIAVYWKLIDDMQTANWQNINNPQTPNWVEIVT